MIVVLVMAASLGCGVEIKSWQGQNTYSEIGVNCIVVDVIGNVLDLGIVAHTFRGLGRGSGGGLERSHGVES